MLIVVCGEPGTGKTTVAEYVAERVDGTLLRTDLVRKELVSEPRYTPAERRRVYDALLDRAREPIERGDAAVLDGTFYDRASRERVRDLAADLGVDLTLVRVECDEAVVRERIERREGDASDADFEVYRLHRDRFEPVEGEHVTIDNSGALESTYRQVEAHF